MARNIFRPDSGLMITFAQITDCIFLSLFFFLGCVPIVTIGASWAALYDATYHAFRLGDKHSWGRFLHTFKGNLRASLIPNLVFLALFLVIGWGTIRLWNMAVAETISWGLFAAGAFAAVLAYGILGILFPMLSRFENPTGVLLKNTLFLGMANLPGTIALGIVNGVSLLLCLRFIFPLFFLPSLASLLGTLFLEPMFRPYMPKEPAACD